LLRDREINDTCLFVLLQLSYNPVVDAEGEGASLIERYEDVLLGHDMALLWPIYPVLDIPVAENVLPAPA
jgi:hypothetical protein